MAPPSDLPRICPAPLPLSPWPHLLFPLPKTHLPLPAVSHTPLLDLLVPVPLWPYGLAQPPGPSCHSWPCSPASLRAPLPTVPTDYLPFPSAPIVVPASNDSAPTPSGRLHAADVSLGVATTPFSPAAVCLAARVLLPPALPPANGAVRATAILLWSPPLTVAACAVNVTPPSAAPPYAAAFLASDAPPHGLLPAPAVAPQSEPLSFPTVGARRTRTPLLRLSFLLCRCLCGAGVCRTGRALSFHDSAWDVGSRARLLAAVPPRVVVLLFPAVRPLAVGLLPFIALLLPAMLLLTVAILLVAVFRLVTALRFLAVCLLVAVPLPVVVRRPVAKLPLSLLVLTLLPP
ncbi:unnamed protein product [Closterium sp. Naga37s-1]|nr:unnamed protein product [Closterium sp. Naga37s-1]